MEVCVIIILVVCVIVLINYYEPSIDIIVENNKYKVLLWYNTTKIDYSDKPTTVRSYKELFII